VKVGQRIVEIVIKAKDEASQHVQSLGKSFDQLKREVPLVGQAFDLIKNPIAQVTLLLVGAAKAAVATYKANVQLGASMDDMSKRTEISVESLSKWGYVAELGGSSISDFESAFIRLRKSMADAINGNQQAMDSFAMLGVQFKNTDGTMRDIEAVMLDIGDALQAHGATSLQAAAAQEVMGRSSAAFAATLRQGSEVLKLQAAEAKAWGGEMSSAFTRTAAASDDAAVRLRTAWGKLTQELTPGLTKITEAAGIMAIMFSGRLKEATQAAWDAEQEFRENFRFFDEAKINAGADAMIAAVDRARKESVERIAAIDKELEGLRAKVTEASLPTKITAAVDLETSGMTIGTDEVMLLEDYQTAMEELRTVQEEMLAAGTPAIMDPDVIAEGDEALKRLTGSVEDFSDSQDAARVGVESFASGIGNLAGEMAGAFLQGDISAMKIGSTIRNVVIGAIKDMIAAFVRAKIVMAGLRLFGIQMAEGGAVPRAYGGAVSRAANGYSIPDGQRGMDSRLILGMPGEEVINRSLSRRLDRFISAYEMGAAVSPFALAGAGGGGGNVINFNVGRPVSVLDALDMGRSAVTASRKYSEASL
jgi:hypothetical protein